VVDEVGSIADKLLCRLRERGESSLGSLLCSQTVEHMAEIVRCSAETVLDHEVCGQFDTPGTMDILGNGKQPLGPAEVDERMDLEQLADHLVELGADLVRPAEEAPV